MRILLAEDNPDDVELLGEALASAGIKATISVVEDGDALAARLAASGLSDEFDLAVLDASLPRRPSLDALRHAVAMRRGVLPIPVVIFSSLVTPQARAEFESAGVSAFFDKPLDFDSYVAVIEQWKALLGRGST